MEGCGFGSESPCISMLSSSPVNLQQYNNESTIYIKCGLIVVEEAEDRPFRLLSR